LDALSCVIQEFFSSIAALFCGTPHYSDAILYYCVGDRTGCVGSLASGFSDAFSRSVQYSL
jgi:hypothetical protein